MNDFTPSLARLAHQARERQSLLAGLLFTYQEQEGLDEPGLAAFLDCDVSALPRLALCRRPRAGMPSFRTDIERISQYAGADSVRLVKLIRAIEARAALQHAAEVPSPMLLAARDHDDAASEKVEDEGESSDG